MDSMRNQLRRWGRPLLAALTAGLLLSGCNMGKPKTVVEPLPTAPEPMTAEADSALSKLVKEAERTKTNIFDIALYKDGQWQTASVNAAPPNQGCYSVTKSFTATAVAIAQEQGRLSIDDPILKYLRDRLPEKYDEKLERVTIKHLLNQTMGVENGFLLEEEYDSLKETDWVTYCLSKPLAHEPGTQFVYSNSTYYLLSAIVHKATDMTLEEFTRENLFKPLGITDYAWASGPDWETVGGTGLYMSTADMGKLGLLYLNKGIYDGKRILSEEWTVQAVKNQQPSPGLYGYSFWPQGYTHMYACIGANQQIVLVNPDTEMILSAHAYLPSYDYLALLEKAK